MLRSFSARSMNIVPYGAVHKEVCGPTNVVQQLVPRVLLEMYSSNSSRWKDTAEAETPLSCLECGNDKPQEAPEDVENQQYPQVVSTTWLSPCRPFVVGTVRSAQPVLLINTMSWMESKRK